MDLQLAAANNTANPVLAMANAHNAKVLEADLSPSTCLVQHWLLVRSPSEPLFNRTFVHRCCCGERLHHPCSDGRYQSTVACPRVSVQCQPPARSTASVGHGKRMLVATKTTSTLPSCSVTSNGHAIFSLRPALAALTRPLFEIRFATRARRLDTSASGVRDRRRRRGWDSDSSPAAR